MGYRVIAGQTADTFADNNYTLPSKGYTMRRAMCSSWMLRLYPALSAVAPRPGSTSAQLLQKSVSSIAGQRVGSMFGNMLGGLTSREQFFGGRVFGYGETPGWSAAYFPILNTRGFEAVTDWYSGQFIEPLTSRMTPESFYRDMIELSLDMNMLHLDTRLLFHVYRLEGATAALPFMDARVMNFFGSIPYSARSLFREPKHLIRNQLRRKGMKYVPLPDLPEPQSQEQLLLEGTLGEYLREIVGDLSFLNRAPGLSDYVDEGYLEQQIATFRSGRPGFNAKLMSKLAAMELWSRALDRRPIAVRENRLQAIPV